MGFEPQGWDLGLENEIWASSLDLNEGRTDVGGGGEGEGR